ncbi:MAG: hypothetical protein E2576_11070 [Alcaligenaceae bacterium]|nr:hypothetical protein [Alcaligenaceae bacterium SAGV5]MPS51251.1 hypothetical protein [Alcaligenaceae bacterium SAGV3]MPT57252.1 hypothetical protein [Alcaligenaceae bacterium]
MADISSIGLRSNIDRIMAETAQAARQHLPFATARALTRVAGEIKVAERAEMARKFDRPTSYTLNSLYVRPATKQNLVARVWLKDDTSKGTPATKYLLPQVEGGGRNGKRFERALQSRGVLPKDWYAIPGDAAQLDAFGNMAASQIRLLLSYFQAAEATAGYKGNMTARRKAAIAKGNAKRGVRGVVYFVSYGKGMRSGDGSWKHGRMQHLPAGIWQRTSFGAWGSAIKPVMLFVRRAAYRRRFDFYGVATRIAAARFEAVFRESLRDAMGS